MSVTEIVEQIRRLPEKERREITEQLLEEFGYLDDDLSPEQIEELEKLIVGARQTPLKTIASRRRLLLSYSTLADTPAKGRGCQRQL